MHYLFGEWNPKSQLHQEDLENILSQAENQRDVFLQTPLENILITLEKVGELWKPGNKYYELALKILPQEVSFSLPMIQKTLEIVPSLCSREILRQRVIANFGSMDVLDQMTPRPQFAGRVRAMPFGVLLHVSAGNVFIGCIDSLIQGFLTKNISLLKLSGRNTQFPYLFSQSILEADPGGVLSRNFAMLSWPGGNQELESILKKRVNAIIAWGGPDMIRAYRDGLGSGVHLIEHGPKLSFQILFTESFAKRNLQEIAVNIASDVAAWDQSACASPQDIFIQEGIDLDALMKSVQFALDKHPVPRGELSPDEEVEILKEKALAEYSELMCGGKLLVGTNSLLWADPEPGLKTSALNRSLVFKRFKNFLDLKAQIIPHADILQSCGYMAEGQDREELLLRLGQWGVQRFAPIGQMMTGMEGGPHDGRYPLVELTRWVADENPIHHSSQEPDHLINFVNDAIQNVAFYRELYSAKAITSIAELKPVPASIFSDRQIFPKTLIRENPDPGFTFSSGGTNGKPKFIYYSYKEFEKVGELLGRGFEAQGLGPHSLCANLFVAGNLWSSFLAVESALKYCQASQLPIGGLADPDLTISYLAQFKPNVILGLPSLLVSLANRARELDISLQIETLCYAGEHLNPQARKLLVEQWGVKKIFSAGYASVDGGPIGYQCAHCIGGTHHLLADSVHLEIHEGEGIITSLVRKNMPIIHLRTGDHLEWIQNDSPCPCGSSNPKFILHGRCDGQMNIWSTRISIADVENALERIGLKEAIYQIVLEESTDQSDINETMIVRIESAGGLNASSHIDFGNALFFLNSDIRSTHSPQFLQQCCRLETVPSGRLHRIARTGKLPSVIDRRR